MQNVVFVQTLIVTGIIRSVLRLQYHALSIILSVYMYKVLVFKALQKSYS